MTIKIKGFIPYALGSKAFYEWCGKAAKSDKTAEVIAHYLASDPHATEWASYGLTFPIDDGRPVHDLDGTARLLTYQFNQRSGRAHGLILLHVDVDLAHTAQTHEVGHHRLGLGGRRGAEKNVRRVDQDVNQAAPDERLRQQIHFDLFLQNGVLLAPDGAAFLLDECGHTFDQDLVAHGARQDALIGRVARAGVEYIGDGDDEVHFSLHAGTSMTIKGEDKRTIRIKDRSVIESDIAALLTEATYTVADLGVSLQHDGDEIASYTMTGTMVFKGIKLSNITTDDIKDNTADSHATAWLLARTFKQMVNATVSAMNEGAEDDADAL